MLAWLLLSGILTFSCSSAENMEESQKEVSESLEIYESQEKTMLAHTEEMAQKQEGWMHNRIPEVLGQARMQAILNDSAAFADYRDLDDRQASIINAHRHNYFSYSELMQGFAPQIQASGAKESETKDKPELAIDWKRTQQRLDELIANEKQLYDSYIIWETNMDDHLARWKTQRFVHNRRNRNSTGSDTLFDAPATTGKFEHQTTDSPKKSTLP